MIDFPDHFLFSVFFFCTLKYENMVRISNISFFRFCWKNEKIDWPKCARTRKAERRQRAVRRFTRFVDYELMFDSGGVHLVSKMICFVHRINNL